jgi:hypothetical protein
MLQKLFDESVPECKAAFASPYKHTERLQRAKIASISPQRTPALTVLYMICVHQATNDRIFADLTGYTFHTMDSRGLLLLIKLSTLRHLQHDHFDTVSCFVWLMTYGRPDETTQTSDIKNSMVWVRERTIPTERPPLVGEVIANFCG